MRDGGFIRTKIICYIQGFVRVAWLVVNTFQNSESVGIEWYSHVFGVFIRRVFHVFYNPGNGHFVSDQVSIAGSVVDGCEFGS